MQLPLFYVDDLIKAAIKEDIHYLDTTTDLMIPEESRSTARFMAKAEGVVCGLEVALRVFQLLDDSFTYQVRLPEGSEVKPGRHHRRAGRAHPVPAQRGAHRAEPAAAYVRGGHRHPAGR